MKIDSGTAIWEGSPTRPDILGNLWKASTKGWKGKKPKGYTKMANKRIDLDEKMISPKKLVSS